MIFGGVRLRSSKLSEATHTRLGEPVEAATGRGRARGSGCAGLGRRGTRSRGPRIGIPVSEWEYLGLDGSFFVRIEAHSVHPTDPPLRGMHLRASLPPSRVGTSDSFSVICLERWGRRG
ncbi:hypothetical protein NDU88_012345 [Pleurodeles waltl]|uniref:Uncharacterized protein n=1 Tax=Pleurodeles waltl TaxID=8319 RepID=A0AAV7R172_PLEWA|nr:hypothetical protein NDU88_012345 [Pleurodeles waltl]